MPRQYTPRLTVVCLACGRTRQKSASRIHKRSFCSESCRVRGRAPLPPIMQPDGSALIPILSRDDVTVIGHATVDAADAEWASQWVWRLHHGYAERGEMIDGKLTIISLHRELLGMPRVSDGSQGDHIDRDRLNNRRANLRIVPKGGNPQNQSAHGGSSSHRGVSWSSVMNKWIVQVRVNGRSKYFGCFASEEEAADRARAVRLEHMPYAVD